MFGNLILRDTRLSGTLPLLTSIAITHELSATKPLRSAFNRVNLATQLNSGPLDSLFVLCHGFAGSNDRAGVSMDAGGMGLQLGQENVFHRNVNMWEAIKDKVRNIVVYACAASNTEDGNEGTTADGRYLMGALAIHTNANVYAADRIQWYNTNNFNFGAWEGQLWKFEPSGEPPTRVSHPPTELSSIIN